MSPRIRLFGSGIGCPRQNRIVLVGWRRGYLRALGVPLVPTFIPTTGRTTPHREGRFRRSPARTSPLNPRVSFAGVQHAAIGSTSPRAPNTASRLRPRKPVAPVTSTRVRLPLHRARIQSVTRRASLSTYRGVPKVHDRPLGHAGFGGGGGQAGPERVGGVGGAGPRQRGLPPVGRGGWRQRPRGGRDRSSRAGRPAGTAARQ